MAGSSTVNTGQHLLLTSHHFQKPRVTTATAVTTDTVLEALPMTLPSVTGNTTHNKDSMEN